MLVHSQDASEKGGNQLPPESLLVFSFLDVVSRQIVSEIDLFMFTISSFSVDFVVFFPFIPFYFN